MLGLNDVAFLAAVAQGKTLWTPAAIPTALWLDAADPATVTTISGATSQWNDKSGNNRNATRATASFRPAYTLAGQNGLNTITYDGINDGLSLEADFSLGTAHTIFVVARNNATITPTTSPTILLSGGLYTSPSTTTSEFIFAAGPITGNLLNETISSLAIAHGAIATDVYGYGKTNGNVLSPFIASTAYTTNNNAYAGRLNGSADFQSTSNNGYVSINTRYPTILRHIGFRGSNNTAFWPGDINEIIVILSYLSLSDTEIFEGYLHHKWGLTANLPADHPYKNTPPMI